MKNKFKDSFNNITINKYNQNNNLDIIINSNKKSFKQKKLLVTFAIIILLSTSTVLAFNMVNKFNTINVNIKDNKTYIKSDAIKKINEQANFDECNSKKKCSSQKKSLGNIEKELEIKVLKDDKINKQEFYPQKIEKKDNLINYASFITEWIEYENITLARYTFSVKTDKYTKSNDNNLPYSNEYKTLYIKNIDTDIVISKGNDSYRITFDYNDISYNMLIFIKNNNGDQEIVDFINSLFE